MPMNCPLCTTSCATVSFFISIFLLFTPCCFGTFGFPVLQLFFLISQEIVILVHLIFIVALVASLSRT
uniref:Uncharacterized protein n=1 Tax=Arundo donax TaxID=35708 RepID=A0A0A8ZM30_ARUDO